MKRTQSLGWGPSSIRTTAVVWAATSALLATPATVGAIERIDAVAMEQNEIARQPAVIDSDSVRTYAYFTMPGSPGEMQKVDLTSLQRVGTTEPASGGRQVVPRPIDPAGAFVYFGRSSGPGQGVKVELGSDGAGLSTTNCGAVERVSVASDGTEGDSDSAGAAVTSDGSLVAFGSAASNLVANDTNEVRDIFVHNRETSTTERVSVTPDGGETDADSLAPAISAGGRYVAFQSLASNLVPDDTNSESDIFVLDRHDGGIERVSVSSDGTEGNGSSVGAAISDDGRFVSFESTASNLVVDDANEAIDVFVHDRETGITERVSVASDGSEGSGGFGLPIFPGAAISGDGRHVAFSSDFTNLVPGDTNFAFDVFVHDRMTEVTERVSTDSDGNQGTGGTFAALPAISSVGHFVAFNADFSNLVPGDTNGDIDVFVHDRETGVTERVSVASDGTEGDHPTTSVGGDHDVSSDGRYVVFSSFHLNLVPEDANAAVDVFVHDRMTGSTRRVSVSSECAEANGGSGGGSLSADGRHVAFGGNAPNLVPDDMNGLSDIFVHTLPDLLISPFPLDFGPVLLGQTRGPLTLTLTNARSQDVMIEEISDPEAPFSAQGGTCAPVPFTLAPDEGCTLDFSFSPTSTGPVETAIVFTSDAADSPHAVTLRGIGKEEPLHIAPDPLDFGGVVPGETGGPESATLTNADGSTAIEIESVSAPTAPFAASGGTCREAPFSLDPFATCTLDYTFSPVEDGSFSDVVEVSSDATSGPLSFALQGEGLVRELTVDPVLLDFGGVDVGEAAGALSATLTNTGDVEVSVEVSPPGAPFTMAESTCPPFFLIFPGASCTLSYTFSPTTPGDFDATVPIVSEAPPPTLSLQGTGLGATIDVDPETLSASLVEGQSETRNLTISNSGNTTLEWAVTEESETSGGLLRPLTRTTGPPTRRPSPSTRGLAPAPGAGRENAVASYPFVSTGTETTLTHSESLDILDGNTITCIPDGSTTPASQFLRTFTLSDFDIAGTFDVSEVTFGIEVLTGTAPIDVNLYTLQGIFEYANLTQIGTATVELAPQALTLVTVPVTGEAPAGATLVVEIAAPDLSGEAAFLPGSNDLGETAPSYVAATACDASEPTRYVDIGFPEVHLVMTVAGTAEPLNCTLPEWVGIDPTAGSVDGGGSQGVDVTFDAAGLEPGDYEADLCLASNDPPAPLVAVPLSLTVAEAEPGKGYEPTALTVDPVARDSNGNAVLEPGELVDVAPSWRNDGEAAQSLTGTASSFTGPPGADYELANDGADYGLIGPGAIASCLDTEVCYRLGINDPAMRPATHWDARFDETLGDSEATSKTWSLHIGASFTDVPPTNLFYPAIETLLHHGVTGGCGDETYCPDGSNTRSQMAIFLLEAALGGNHQPPACVEGEEAFDDVPFDNLFCPWIEELSSRGITSGCGGGNYCPGDTVTRAQMAIFLLKAAEGSGYTPPPCAGEFGDVPCSSPFTAWIEELAARGITAGCGGGNYCPAAPVTRAQMAVFVTKTFGLSLYGP